MKCYCYRLTAAHEHSPQACTSPIPVPPREVSTTDAARPYVATRDGQPVELTLSEMSVRHMMEQVAEEEIWKERLRPQIEYALRHRIADEIEGDYVPGLKALEQLYELVLANKLLPDHQLQAMNAIIMHAQYWVHGIRKGSVGREP